MSEGSCKRQKIVQIVIPYWMQGGTVIAGGPCRCMLATVGPHNMPNLFGDGLANNYYICKCSDTGPKWAQFSKA